MRRKEFITLVGGAAAWPVVARGQQAKMPVIGFLGGSNAFSNVEFVTAFNRGLMEIGYVQSRNVEIEFRWANENYDRLPMLATELARYPVAVLVTVGIPAAQAAKAANLTISTVFEVADDPVANGLVTSLNRPGGNATGAALMSRQLVGKRLQLLRELVPNGRLIGLLINPNNPSAEIDINEIEAAARSLGQELLVLKATAESDFIPAFEKLVQQRVSALVVNGDSTFGSRRELIAGLSLRHAIPTIYDRRRWAEVGGLMTYGSSFFDAGRQVGVYAGRILKGEKPSDLPVVQPTKFELVINLRTAKILGITVPPTLLALADEVIE